MLALQSTPINAFGLVNQMASGFLAGQAKYRITGFRSKLNSVANPFNLLPKARLLAYEPNVCIKAFLKKVSLSFADQCFCSDYKKPFFIFAVNSYGDQSQSSR